MYLCVGGFTYLSIIHSFSVTDLQEILIMYEAPTEMGKSRVCSELPTAWLGRMVHGSRAEEGPPARGLGDG